MSKKIWFPLAGIALLIATGPVQAHHAFSAEFDASRPLKLEGAITKVELVNPHAWIHMEVKKPDGKVEAWMVEAGAPNALLRRGFTKASLPPKTLAYCSLNISGLSERCISVWISAWLGQMSRR